MDLITAAFLGGAFGYCVRGPGGKTEPVDWDRLLKYLANAKPVLYETTEIDCSTAHTNNEPIHKAGDYIRVEQHSPSVPVYLQLNEPDAAKINLLAEKEINAPFYRLFVTNAAGSGSIILKTFRGFRLTGREPGIEELAARLKSPYTFNRTGEVLWLDDFSSGISKFGFGTSGTGGTFTSSSDSGYISGKCAELLCPTTLLRQIYMKKAFPYPKLSKMGVEFSVCLGRYIDEFRIQIELYDGSTQHWYVVYWDRPKTISYDDSGLVKQTLDSDYRLENWNINLDSDPRMYHIVKLIVDPENDKYDKLIINNKVWDMSNISPYTTGATGGAHLYVTLTFEGLSGKTGTDITARVGHLALIQNEP